GGTIARREDGGVDAQRGLSARLLAALAVDSGRSVPDEALLDRLWPGGPPDNAIASLRNVVAKVRRTMGAASIEWVGSSAGQRWRDRRRDPLVGRCARPRAGSSVRRCRRRGVGDAGRGGDHGT